MDNFSIIIKTLCAVILGGVIGLERQSKHRPAGFRTHMLVCLGAMTVMILSESLFQHYHSAYGAIFDPARMGAQVISGIGFLGAGTIIHYGTNVKGLTTAASLWAVAAIGLTIGAGYYFLAFFETGTIFTVLLLFNAISKKMNDRGHIWELTLDLINKPKALGGVNTVFAESGLKVLDMEYSKPSDLELEEENKAPILSIRVVLQARPGMEFHVLLNKLEAVNGVIKVERV